MILTPNPAVDYFSEYGQHFKTESFYTSDYDLSEFDSHFLGLGLRMIAPNGIFGVSKFNAIEIRLGHYSRQTGLVANIISLSARFK